MKKILTILLLVFFISTNTCYAFSELYFVKNAKTAQMEHIVEGVFANQGYTLTKKNPYYGVAQNGKDYAVVIIQQSGENLFYYFNSDNNSKVNKNILKQLKYSYLDYEQSLNANAINIYDSLVSDIISSKNSNIKSYSFEEPQTEFTQNQNSVQKSQPQTTLQGYVAQVPAGSKINVYLQNAINTSNASKGDNVTAVLTNNLEYNGVIIAPQGSLVYGTLSKANHATYGSRNGRVIIQFNQIVTPENKVYNISAEDIDFSVSEDGKAAEITKGALVLAGIGALMGLLAAASSNSLRGDARVGKAVAIGAAVGAGSSVIYNVSGKGADAEIPSFTELELTLTKPLNVSVNY